MLTHPILKQTRPHGRMKTDCGGRRCCESQGRQKYNNWMVIESNVSLARDWHT